MRTYQCPGLYPRAAYELLNTEGRKSTPASVFAFQAALPSCGLHTQPSYQFGVHEADDKGKDNLE